MTIGIYSLYWEEPDLIYIGQSSNIETRLKKHLSMLKCNTHPNYKVQRAYDNFGAPTTGILDKCEILELDSLEATYISEFNSIGSGLNICEVQSGNGISYANPNAKYSKYKLLRVFARLASGNYSMQEVSSKEDVSRGLVSRIAAGTHHRWLAEEYPDKYAIIIATMFNNKLHNSRGGRSEISAKLVSPNGTPIEFTNITKFCKENNLHQSAISMLLAGKRNSHKGYTLYKESK